MCFSATVSYSSAALLVPTGLYLLRLRGWAQARYWMVASIPLLFGVQQAIEGRLWQALNEKELAAVPMLALAFLFFSHVVWPLWIPLASYLQERDRLRQRLFLAIAIFAGLAAASVYIPLLLHPQWVSVDIRQHSIHYGVHSLFSEPGMFGYDKVLYGTVILVPLLFSSQPYLRRFGIAVALSMAVTLLFYNYAFVSVWCLFAALLSFYLVAMAHSGAAIHSQHRAQAIAPPK